MMETKALGRDDVPDYGERARRMRDLIASPVMPLADLSLFLDVPLSTLDKLRAQGNGPRTFKIGRRLYLRQTDMRVWLDKLAETEAA